MDTTARNTTIRDRHRKQIARGRPPCSICGAEIDYTLRYPDPMCYVVDHVIPWAKGGSDTLDNKAAAHSACNRLKWDTVAGDDNPVTYITARNW